MTVSSARFRRSHPTAQPAASESSVTDSKPADSSFAAITAPRDWAWTDCAIALRSRRLSNLSGVARLLCDKTGAIEAGESAIHEHFLPHRFLRRVFGLHAGARFGADRASQARP